MYSSSGFTIYGNSTANTTLGITNNLVSADGTAVWFQNIIKHTLDNDGILTLR